MDGYSAFHLVRTNIEHGSISIFFKNYLNADVLHEYCLIDEYIELHTLKVKIDTIAYIIATVHRPHSCKLFHWYFK